MPATNPITEEGLRNLLGRLGEDLARIESAPQIPPDQKQNLRMLLSQIRLGVRGAVADPPEAWPDWVRDMRPLFDSLSTQLNEHFGEPKGACHYAGGCIQTTKPHCDFLSGTFFPGTPC